MLIKMVHRKYDKEWFKIHKVSFCQGKPSVASWNLNICVWTLAFLHLDGQIVFLLIFVLSKPFPTYQEMVLDRLFRDMSRLPLLFTSITDILALLPHVCHGQPSCYPLVYTSPLESVFTEMPCSSSSSEFVSDSFFCRVHVLHVFTGVGGKIISQYIFLFLNGCYLKKLHIIQTFMFINIILLGVFSYFACHCGFSLQCLINTHLSEA